MPVSIKLASLYLLLILVASGCTSMQPLENVSNPQTILQSINPGDRVHIETLDGSKYEMQVTAIEIDSIQDDTREIPLDQIKVLKKEKISKLKTTGAIAGGLLVYLMLAAVIIVAAIT